MRHLAIGTVVCATLGIGLAVGSWMERAEIPADHVLKSTLKALSPGMALADEADQEISPTLVRDRPRDAYYPNTEDLDASEMRVIACGTGMPTTRAAQAAACFLVELGNGDKFFFDIGSGSSE